MIKCILGFRSSWNVDTLVVLQYLLFYNTCCLTILVVLQYLSYNTCCLTTLVASKITQWSSENNMTTNPTKIKHIPINLATYPTASYSNSQVTLQLQENLTWMENMLRKGVVKLFEVQIQDK